MYMKKFNDLALSMRRNIIRQTFVAGVGHTGGALSMVEIIISIYEYFRKYYSESNLPHVVISKGHAAACLYAWLAEQGHIEYSELDKYRALGSITQSHVKPPSKMSPGIKGFYPSGSLTHGLSLASGIAISEQLDSPDDPMPVFCVMGDTEMQGGQIWETAMQIAFHKLNHIIAFVDDNGMGNDYATKDTLDVGDLRGRFESCGWYAKDINDGHNVVEIIKLLSNRPNDRPTVIVAKTIKGKGVSFMEGDNIWHGRGPNDEQFIKASNELEMNNRDVENALQARKKRIATSQVIFPREKTLRDSPADALIERMKKDDRIVIIAPELAESTQAARIGREFPERVFNFGIQEPNAMDAVAGLSFAGKIPVIITFTNFVLLRTVDQIFQNIAPFCNNALIIGTHDGLLEDGMSVTPYNHFAIARSFYRSNVFAPADYYESISLTNAALDKGGYSFIFNSREKMPIIFNEETTHKIGVSKIYSTHKNLWADRTGVSEWKEYISSNINIITTGSPYVWLVQQAIKELYVELKLNISLVNLSSIKPLDTETLENVFKICSHLIVIEKHSPYGGIYSAISEFAFDNDLRQTKISHYPEKEWVGQSGTPDEQLLHYGFDKDSIKKFILTNYNTKDLV